jgi:predicted ribosome quality control (RQC) complex YloA/Tae2 family protein
MSLNTKEIDLILEELDLRGSYIQKVVQSDFQSLHFSLYKPGNKTELKISLAPGKTRICRTTGKGKKGAKLQRFEQFLRSRILSGRITEASEHDRIITIGIIKGGEVTKLYIRLWGGNANIIASDSENRILDAFYRRPGKDEQSGSILTIPEKKSHKEFKVREYPSDQDFNTFIDRYYSDIERNETIERLKNRLNILLNKKAIYLESKINKSESEFEKYDRSESFRQYGDLLLSFSSKWNKRDEWLEVENYYDNNNTLRIELDPDISIEKNAEKYFTKYRKLKKSRENYRDELSNLENRLNRIRKKLKEVENEESIKVLSLWLKETETDKKGDVPGKKQIPGLQFYSGGFTILVGRGAKENDELLRHHVKGNDYWLHARDYPGGYVFIRNLRGKSIPLETLLDAGNLAVFYSKGKNSGRGEVYYTQVKYLRRTKTGKTGLVIPTQEKNLSITIDDKRIIKLFDMNST